MLLVKQTKKNDFYIIFKGSIVCLNTILLIYKSLDPTMTGPHKIGVTLLIAVSTCVISFICALLLWILDNRRRRVAEEDSPSDPGK